jgi:hypothetical protein
MRAWPVLLTTALFVLGCMGEKPPEVDPYEEAAAKKCPAVHLDRMNIAWVHGSGQPTRRMEIVREGEAWSLHQVEIAARPIGYKGEKREKDVRFIEIPSAEKQAFIARGEATLNVAYVAPNFRNCALDVFVGTVDAKGKETLPPRPEEYLPMPSAGVVFSFQPWTDAVFLGDAAMKRATAEKELAERDAPRADVQFGEAVPVAAWTQVEADGDAACTYDMDLYFDGQRVEEKVPAAAPEGGWRAWRHLWNAPYSGNHSFEIYRFRTCADGARTLIGVAGTEAILMG